jgi:hypothetical protein
MIIHIQNAKNRISKAIKWVHGAIVITIAAAESCGLVRRSQSLSLNSPGSGMMEKPSECMRKAAGSWQVHRYGIPPSSGVQAGSDLLAAKLQSFIIAA